MRADWWESIGDGKVKCGLCPHNCTIAPGACGICLARRNEDGVLVATQYGRVASVALDPIEKKPLYHFHPGSQILSIGGYGCNLRCSFCQNYHLSTALGPTRKAEPTLLVSEACAHGSVGIAYTYNEPIINLEYIRDCATLARRAGLANVLVTNGFVMPGPLDDVLPLIDAANVDLKAWSDDFYRDLCGARLLPVLDALKVMAGRIHVEVTTLVIPTQNDDSNEIEALAAWVAQQLGSDTALHLSAYRPAHRAKFPATSLTRLQTLRTLAKRHLHHVYLGNVASDSDSDTQCAGCGSTLVRRSGYSVRVTGLADGKCAGCGRDSSFLIGVSATSGSEG